MIHGIGMLAMMAPEIGEAVLDGLTRKVVSIAIDEAGAQLSHGASGLLGGFGKSLGIGLSAFASEADQGLRSKARAGVEDVLSAAGASLVAADELALLLAIAKAADGGDPAKALSDWKAWREERALMAVRSKVEASRAAGSPPQDEPGAASAPAPKR